MIRCIVVRLTSDVINFTFPGLAWSIIPNDIGIASSTFTYNSWRIFLLICAAPSFIVAGLLLLLPESPKYLLSCGRYEEALDIFRGIYAINTGKSRDSYTVNTFFSCFLATGDVFLRTVLKQITRRCFPLSLDLRLNRIVEAVQEHGTSMRLEIKRTSTREKKVSRCFSRVFVEASPAVLTKLSRNEKSKRHIHS